MITLNNHSLKEKSTLRRQNHLQSGQVGIVVLLIMVVVLGIAIGVSRRTIQQQDTAFIQDESTRVFNAAESGVEDALSKIAEAEQTGEDLATTGTLDFDDDQVRYNIEASNQFEMYVSAGDTIEIPLEGEDDNVTIRWNYNRGVNCSTDNPAAIVASAISANNAKHYGFDPCETVRHTNFHSNDLDATGDYSFSVDIPVEASDHLLRIKPLFNSTRLNVSASNAINLAQHNIDSTGYNEAQDIARTIELRRSVPGNYSFMDYTLVSGSSLSKN